MEHPHGGLATGGVDTALLPLVLRLVLLLTGAVVAGIGLLRPQLTALPGRLVLVASAASAVSAALAVVSVAAADVHWLGALGHVLLVAAVPALLARPVAARWAAVALGLLLVVETTAGRSGVDFALDTVYVAASTAWLGLAAVTALVPADQRRAPRADQLTVTLGGALAVVGAVRLVSSGLAFDRRVVGSALGLVLVAAVALPLLVTALAVVRAGTARRWGAVGVAAGFVAWTAIAAVPVPPALPTPGVPVLVDLAVGDTLVPTLVTPNRPGTNLVHFPASAGRDLTVAVAGGAEVPAVPRAGAEGTWAEVELPQGRSDLTVTRGGDTDRVDLDTGTDLVDLRATGPDGPECASAALGSLVAGRRDTLTACPGDALSPQDDEALRKLVGFLKARGAAGVVLRSDTSPRGSRAAQVVQDEATAQGLRVDTAGGEDNALVVVGGWESAAGALNVARTQQSEAPVYQYGLYVAPWLVNTPLVTSVTSVNAPLRFDPRETQPVTYAIAVGNAFGGESPTLEGLRAWLGDRVSDVDGKPRIYAAAQVTVMSMAPGEPHAPGMPMSEDLPGQWVGKATIVPVSGVLL
ncbi:hypothetical protein [Actinokineospora bangkokensis]|uniref:Uncharacterized protein n=1 Tax=Actinokineospora bangkokensis TaxID=1193682 RepID=A0A1Q9LGU6_9PSEU|nr:hypothetical protein [Actinokineospora bangkokensis]OLR91271.1 hypothetical protein BJP25_26750 [Actinokineospora bangkokensis]